MPTRLNLSRTRVRYNLNKRRMQVPTLTRLQSTFKNLMSNQRFPSKIKCNKELKGRAKRQYENYNSRWPMPHPSQRIIELKNEAEGRSQSNSDIGHNNKKRKCPVEFIDERGQSGYIRKQTYVTGHSSSTLQVDNSTVGVIRKIVTPSGTKRLILCHPFEKKD
ncbi:10317_t:CDS:1 [Ambispora leptoticha]|uniref:10317_t:CDS:1 n=1 Tax=Ambispora leptoticha TaxID=144679 RepID=A0A9N8V756_9GLOM|nr:10317_t:CDS:1 [Ambispora leptoticha]